MSRSSKSSQDALAAVAASEPQAVGRDTRSHLRQIIAHLAEGIIIVEDDGTIGSANEAALAMHGVERIADLGGDLAGYVDRYALSYRNRHVLDEAEYPIARAIRGEAISDVVVCVGRRGSQPEWTHRVRTLALAAEGDERGFSAVVIVDATEQYDAEARFEKTFGANPAPAIICRLEDSRYVKVNRGFLEMTGHHRDDLIGATISDVDVLGDAARRQEAMERLKEGATIPQMEARLRLPAGGEKAVIVAGQPIEIADEACMLFTFIDLDYRRKGEIALSRSEERFAKTFQLAPVPMLMISSRDSRILHANDAFVSEFGHGRAAAIGRSKAELDLWGDEGSEALVAKLVREHGRASSVEVSLRTRGGRNVAFLLSAETVTILEEECTLVVMLNVEDKRRSEAEILAAVDAALHDTSWLGRKIVERLNAAADSASGRGPCPSDALSVRQKEVLKLVAQGMSDGEITDRLQIARNTVRNHVRAIYLAIGVHHRGEAVAWARRRGLGGQDR